MSPDPWEPKKMIKDTHFAFFGLPNLGGRPLTVAEWIRLHPSTDKLRYFYPTSWHKGQPYVEEVTLLPRWYLLRIEIVPGSTGKLPDEQLRMLPATYEIPITIAETTKDLFVFHKTGIRPNPSRWARCAEVTVKIGTYSAGSLSCVGLFGEDGLNVSSWRGDRRDGVGAGASRKILEPLNA